jgi:hypothetical protein
LFNLALLWVKNAIFSPNFLAKIFKKSYIGPWSHWLRRTSHTIVHFSNLLAVSGQTR